VPRRRVLSLSLGNLNQEFRHKKSLNQTHTFKIWQNFEKSRLDIFFIFFERKQLQMNNLPKQTLEN
jgi:hypothetical protein